MAHLAEKAQTRAPQHLKVPRSLSGELLEIYLTKNQD